MESFNFGPGPALALFCAALAGLGTSWGDDKV